MSNDTLISRLRAAGDREEGRPYSTMHDAADEIERLRGLVPTGTSPQEWQCAICESAWSTLEQARGCCAALGLVPRAAGDSDYAAIVRQQGCRIMDLEDALRAIRAATNPEVERLRSVLRQIELNTREGTPLVKKLNWLAKDALTSGQHPTKE